MSHGMVASMTSMTSSLSVDIMMINRDPPPNIIMFPVSYSIISGGNKRAG